MWEHPACTGRVCRELPLWEHPALELSCHIVKFSIDLASHNDNRTSPIPSEPLVKAEWCNCMQSMTVTIQRISKKEYPGPELIRNHQTYRKGLQRAPLVGASGLGIVLSHQTNLALISHHTMTKEPRQSPRSNSSGKNDATACNR